MDVLLGTVLTLAGLAVVGGAVWLRLGPTPGSREWVAGQRDDERSGKVVLLRLPGGGFMLAAFGLTRFGTDGPWVPWVGVCAILGIALVLTGVFVPRPPMVLYPGWAREIVRERRSRRGTRVG